MPQPHRLLDVEDFRAEARAGNAPDAMLLKLATSDPTVVGGAGSRTRRFVFSDATVDHSNDSISPNGWDLSVFRRNPVALWAHDSMAPPVGRASNVGVSNGKLVGDIEFAPAEVYEFADTVFRLVSGGYIKAVSVGFLPKDWKFTTDRNRPNGIDFVKQLLAEISIVPVPCNPSALIEARAAGVDTRLLKRWAEDVLDSDGASPLPRRDLEALRRQAAEPSRGRVNRSTETEGLNRIIDDVNQQIYAGRQTAKDIKALIPPPPDPNAGAAPPPPFDIGLAEQAMGHVREATSRQARAVDCIRQAIARAPDTPDPMNPNKRRGYDLSTPAGRLAALAEDRAIWERRQNVREIARQVGPYLAEAAAQARAAAVRAEVDRLCGRHEPAAD